MAARTRTFLCGGLLVFLAGTAMAGAYQRTIEGNVLVWNDRPQPGEEATWSGWHDAEGYATGYGTLTWYARGKLSITGSAIPSRRRTAVVATYYGTMVHGKFVEHHRLAATSPAARRNQQRAASPAPENTATPARRRSTEPIASKPSPTPAPTPSATAAPGDNSLNTLTHPPASLQLNTPSEAAPQGSPHPTPAEWPSP
jgi:hypothetical protein